MIFRGDLPLSTDKSHFFTAICLVASRSRQKKYFWRQSFRGLSLSASKTIIFVVRERESDYYYEAPECFSQVQEMTFKR